MDVLVSLAVVLAVAAAEFDPTRPIKMVLPYLIALAVVVFVARMWWEWRAYKRRRRQRAEEREAGRTPWRVGDRR